MAAFVNAAELVDWYGLISCRTLVRQLNVHDGRCIEIRHDVCENPITRGVFVAQNFVNFF